MRNTTAILAVAALAATVQAAPNKRLVTDPKDRSVTGNELAYNITAPVATGGQAWADAHAKVVALVEQMSLQEKVRVLRCCSVDAFANSTPFD
jgi:hypothetical protein